MKRGVAKVVDFLGTRGLGDQEMMMITMMTMMMMMMMMIMILSNLW